MRLYEEVRDRLGQANILKSLGDIAYIQNEYSAMREAFQRALNLATQIGDFAGRLHGLAGLAQVEKATGSQSSACDYYERVLGLAVSHPAFANHPVVEGWRREFADLGCE
jgi:uncharacterized protein HemY